jgi:hypothetical protein
MEFAVVATIVISATMGFVLLRGESNAEVFKAEGVVINREIIPAHTIIHIMPMSTRYVPTTYYINVRVAGEIVRYAETQRDSYDLIESGDAVEVTCRKVSLHDLQVVAIKRKR